MNRPLMKCGHTANSHKRISDEEATDMREKELDYVKVQFSGHNRLHACVVCNEVEIVQDPPKLDGRKAVCDHCKKETDSCYTLPFFSYQGPGSRDAEYLCGICGMVESVHPKPGHMFMPRGPKKKDRYYCGCLGWD